MVGALAESRANAESANATSATVYLRSNSPLSMSGLRVEDLAVIRRARADALAAELRAEATAEAEERVDEDAASVETKDVRAAPGRTAKV